MIKIKRNKRPNISIYKDKRSSLDRNPAKDQALRNQLMALIDGTKPQYQDVFQRIANNMKFTKAEAETLKAIAFFADDHNFKDDKKLTNKKLPTFTVYKDAELKKNLKLNFNNKCAYCESTFGHVTPPDIEHFRPKAAINNFSNQQDEDLIYPGYYWLGAEWNNLLWSCPLCNRKTKQDVPDFVDPQPVGKKNRFPVEGKRIRNHHEIWTDEEPRRLLIDPCKDDPAEHLEFLLDGKVTEKLDAQGKPSAMAKASILAYGLNRAELKTARDKAILLLRGLLRGLVNNIKLLDMVVDDDEKKLIEDDFLFQKKTIQQMLAPTSAFLAQKHVIIDDFFTKRKDLKKHKFTKESLLN